MLFPAALMGSGASECLDHWYPGCFLQHWLSGDPQDAKKAIDTALRKNPNNIDALRARAQISSKMGHTALARFGVLKNWDGLITDSGLTAPLAISLKRAGCTLIQSPRTG